ncbi:dynamin-2B isoform X1 [Selaginella moellendorffii]|uniref:dynamin-2B isoform X1 n=1 Tax=Selaginella moellendorffii TaxID=88036 RepID=UPI000D1CF4BC|nr:dynamin-2B isoform X1 [Selaginella moellendorffii]XP_024543233.1 dynamin-2B isoform X1 [Selaginella moellendorffii]|eukprot:XP_024543226.1 dynamin-2B isoform X1 [Selaginella moellendorffii]
MENLVSLAEAMQQASSVLLDDNDDSAQYTTFLNVVTIGNTGAGKSAVLNSIIGYTVMPTGENGATRAPIVVELERDQSEGKGLAVMTEGRARPSSANEIRLSLQSRISRILSSRSSRPEEIRLRLRSSAAPPLTLIDLPGLASLDDQFVNEYGSHNDAVLLVVVPATSVRDITGSQALKMARELDPEFSRTVGVISKVDQSASDPKSLAAVQAVLSGQGPSASADITWVALIGQSVSIAAAHAGSVGTDDSLETAWKAETETLRSILTAAPSTRLGRAALVDVISKQIRKRIRQRLPSLLSGLEGRQQEVEGELVRLGEQMVETEEGTRALALELCREFEDKYILHINSGETGGWRVISSFEGALPNKFKNLPLNDLFDLNYLKKVVLEADGYQPYLLSPEKGLRELVRRALELAKDPGKHCVDEVHHVLVDIVAASASSTPGLGRYPPFKREVVAIASAALDEYRTHAKKMVVDLVDMERSYIPPQHFNRLAQRRIDRLRREEETKTRVSKKAQDAEQVLLNKAAGPPVNQTPPLKSIKGQSDKDKDSKDGKDGAPSSIAGGEISGVYLMKKSTNKSGWKKRWFVLNEKTNRLGYTKTPDERLFRGVINLEECAIDDASEKDDDDAPTTKSSKKERASDSSISLAFKITNKVPYKSVLKAHSSVVLKAESIADKQEWIAKLRNCAQGTQQPPGKSASIVKEPSRAPEPVQDTVIRRPADPDEDLRFMGQEVRDYVEAVLNSLSANIPKAVVLCQVEKSKDAMLNKLYSSISKFSSAQIQELLQEDPEVKRRRDKCQRQSQVLNKLTHQLSMHEARVSTVSGYTDTDGYGSPSSSKGAGEEWRVAFESASTAPPPSKSLSINGRIDRRFTATEENGDIGSSRRSTPSRAAPAPPGSMYRG